MTVTFLCAALVWHGPTASPAAADPPSTATATITTTSAAYTAALTRHQEALSNAVTVRAAAKVAAERVREATTAELAADKQAVEAARTLRKLARQQYIAGGATDIENVASIITGGPETLTDMSRADAVNKRVGQHAASTAQETLDASAAATEATKRALAEHATATAAVAEADAEVIAAEGDANAAAAAYENARTSAACTTATAGTITPTMEKFGRRIAELLAAEGFTTAAIAAILGNLQQESELDPTKRQLKGGPGRGLAQWTAGGRWDTGTDSLAAYAAARDLDVWALDTQVGFMLTEMRNKWGGFNIDTFAASTDTVDATVYFHDVYERSADSADFVRDVRGGNAKRWSVLLNGGDPASCGTRPAPAPEGLNMLLPAGWNTWQVPGGSERLHPDARRAAQYVHATNPTVSDVSGWRDGPRGEHSSGLSVDFTAPSAEAARIAEMFARYATQFGVEKVRYNGHEYVPGAPGTGWGEWPTVAATEEKADPGQVHITVWGNRSPERNAPNGLWAGR